MSEEYIQNSLYLELGKEYFSHDELLKESYIEHKFNFTHLIISPDYYVKLMSSPEIQTYSFFGSPTTLFDDIEVMVSPHVKKWKWVCDFK